MPALTPDAIRRVLRDSGAVPAATRTGEGLTVSRAPAGTVRALTLTATFDALSQARMNLDRAQAALTAAGYRVIIPATATDLYVTTEET